MARERRLSPSARRGARVFVIALVSVVSLNLIATTGVAKATSGDILRTLIPNPGGNGRALAFDRATRHLFYTNQGDPHIYVINTKGDPIATLSPVDATTGQPIVYGALTWRAAGGGGMLWGGRFDGTGLVDQIDPVTGAVTTTFTFQFPPGDSCYPQPPGYMDGLAFDPSDGTLWMSDDNARTVFHVDSKGTELGRFTVPDGRCNTGIALNGDFLWLALQSGADKAPYDIVQVAKPTRPGSKLAVLSSFGFGGDEGPEGIAFDGSTFGKCALWSNQFGDRTILKAWECSYSGVSGRVVEGNAGQPTLGSTAWPATFWSVGPIDPSNYKALVNWGDGSSPTRASVATAAARYCPPIPSSAHCFVVDARHTYANAGEYVTNVTISGPGGVSAGKGVAQIVDPSRPGDPSKAVGPITFILGQGSIYPGHETQTFGGCTASALANVNVIMLVGHCTFHNDTFEFAPQHTGQCSTGVTDVELLTCENEGNGTNPVGVWRASAPQVYASAGSNDSDAVTFIAVPNWISLGVHGGNELRTAVPGIPVHFNPPRGLFWKQYGYPDDEGVWELKWCLGHDQSSSGNFEMASADCKSTFKSGDLVGAGTSGGPWVNSRFLANAAGAVHNQAVLSGDQYILKSVPLDDDAMRAYIRAVLASCGQCGPGPLEALSPGHAVAPPSTSSHVGGGA